MTLLCPSAKSEMADVTLRLHFLPPEIYDAIASHVDKRDLLSLS